MSNYSEHDYWIEPAQRALTRATARLEEELIRQEVLRAYYERRPLRNIVLPLRPYDDWSRPTTRVAALAQIDVEHIYL